MIGNRKEGSQSNHIFLVLGVGFDEFTNTISAGIDPFPYGTEKEAETSVGIQKIDVCEDEIFIDKVQVDLW